MSDSTWDEQEEEQEESYADEFSFTEGLSIFEESTESGDGEESDEEDFDGGFSLTPIGNAFTGVTRSIGVAWNMAYRGLDWTGERLYDYLKEKISNAGKPQKQEEKREDDKDDEEESTWL